MNVCSDALYLSLLADVGHIVGEQDARREPWPDITPRQYAVHALLNSFYKKFVDNESRNASSVALEKFETANKQCSDWELNLSNSLDETLYGEFKRAIYEFWYPKGEPLVGGFYDLHDRGVASPGSAVDSNGMDFYTKFFSSKLSYTNPFIRDMYELCVKDHPVWEAAEITRSKLYGNQAQVKGSRLSFVNKTNDEKRVTCSEPPLNMFYQLGLAGILEDRIREVWNISLSDQPDFNRLLAWQGSIGLDRCTIDLSSASDTIGYRMCKEVMPRDMFAWFDLLRCTQTEVDGRAIELSMISSMGNGFTFPLETMLFLCIVTAAFRTAGVKMVRNKRYQDKSRNRPGNFGVFGDDIIAPAQIARWVIRLCGLLGFTVNVAKTFVEGPFRESCGSDYFKGLSVRGVYIKSIVVQQDRYAIINNLSLWTARTGISLRRSVAYLLKSVRYLPVPLHENEDGGVRTPLALCSPKWNGKVYAYVYRRYVASPKRLSIRDGVIHSPKGVKKRLWNPYGLEMAALHGSIRKSKISIRLDVTLYSAKCTVTPSWDRCASDCGFLPQVNKMSLNDATFFNLNGLKGFVM